jgi:ribosomal protein S18 acetylase RimI-like enzyme
MVLSINEMKWQEVPFELFLEADPNEQNVRQYLIKSTVFAATEGESIIGEIVLQKTGTDTMEIMNLCVADEHQRKGVGTALVTFAIDAARTAGMRYIYVGTGNPGAGQMLLYQRCGFRIIGVDLDYFRRYYPERIYEGGIECRDMIRMRIDFQDPESMIDQGFQAD